MKILKKMSIYLSLVLMFGTFSTIAKACLAASVSSSEVINKIEIREGRYDRYNYMTWKTYYQLNTPTKKLGSVYSGWIIPYSFTWVHNNEEIAYARNSLLTLTDRINVYSSKKVSKKTKYYGQIRRKLLTDLETYNFYDSKKDEFGYSVLSLDGKSLQIFEGDFLIAELTPNDLNASTKTLKQSSSYKVVFPKPLETEKLRLLTMFSIFYINSLKVEE